MPNPLYYLLLGSIAADPLPGQLMLALSGDIEPTNGNAPRWWDGVTGTAPTTGTTPTGVYTRAWNNTAGGRSQINFPSTTLNPAFCIRIYVTGDTTGLICRMANGVDDHLTVGYLAGGNFRILVNGIQVNASTGGHIALNTYFWLVGSAVVANSPNGSYTCTLYNDSLTPLETVNATGVDTQDGSSSVGNTVVGGFTGWWEDYSVAFDMQFGGPSRVEVTPPSGAGDLTQIATRTGTDSGNNWDQVNEMPLASTAVDAIVSTGDQTDTYTFAAGSIAGTLLAVGVQAACVTTAGSVDFNFVCRIGGVTYEHATTHTATTTADMFASYWRNNPATNAPWTAAERNAAQFGIRERAANGAVRGLYRVSLVQL